MMRHRLLIPAAFVLLGGCAATPEPVLQLADKAAANAGVVSARLRQLAEASDALYANRAANISHLHAVNATQRAYLEYDLALTRKVGQDSDIVLMKDLQAWTAEVNRLLAQSANAEKSRRDELVAAQMKIDTRTQSLQKVAQILVTLAKQETAEERAKLLAAFARELGGDVKKQLDDGSEASNAARSLIDQIKSAKQ